MKYIKQLDKYILESKKSLLDYELEIDRLQKQQFIVRNNRDFDEIDVKIKNLRRDILNLKKDIVNPLLTNNFFMDWFGRSELRTKNKPLIFYHRSNSKNIKEFDMAIKKNRFDNIEGIYFHNNDSNIDYGKYGKYVYPCYIKMERPFYKESGISIHTIKQRERSIIQVMKDYYKGKGMSIEYMYEMLSTMKEFKNLKHSMDGELKRLILIELGYDGAIDGNSFMYNKNGKNEIEFVAFYPNHVKSINNTGKWSNNTNNIYK